MWGYPLYSNGEDGGSVSVLHLQSVDQLGPTVRPALSPAVCNAQPQRVGAEHEPEELEDEGLRDQEDRVED